MRHLLPQWVLANVVAAPVAIAVGLLAPLIVLAHRRLFSVLLLISLPGFLMGLCVGTAQWLVLRRQLAKSWGWIIATALAGALVTTIAIPRYTQATIGPRALLEAALSGFAVGLAQWVVLRRIANATWWILASIVGLALGTVVAKAIIPEGTLVRTLLSGLVVALGYGIVTGYALARLLGANQRAAL